MRTEPTRTRVVTYVRVSMDKQASDGLSLDIIATKVDAGASAKSLDRPALQDALALLRSGEATALSWSSSTASPTGAAATSTSLPAVSRPGARRRVGDRRDRIPVSA